jgi:hypothetical protein
VPTWTERAHSAKEAGCALGFGRALQKPPAELDPHAIDASLMVFDVSLDWLRRKS